MDNPSKTQNDFIHSFARDQAIEFAEWCETYYWWKSTDTRFPLTLGRWTRAINGDVPVDKTFTTSELYSQFLDHQKKQQEQSKTKQDV